MAEQPGRPLPTTTMQLAGHATGALVEGLTNQNKAPMMLGIVLLNILGICAAVYFLNVMIQGQQEHLKSLLALQQEQQEKMLVMHKWEFDQLLALTNSVASIQATASIPAPQQPPPPAGRRPQ